MGTKSSLFSTSTDIFTSEPVQETVTEKPATILTAAEQDIYDSLTSQEKRELSNVIQGMDLRNPNFSFEYGREERQGMAKLNEDALSVTLTKDLGELGKSMSNLMVQLKGIDIPDQSRGIFNRTRSYIAQLSAKLTPAKANVKKTVKIMEGYKAQLIADNISLDKLYKQNWI